MTSCDERARYEAVYDLHASQLSGLNLFTVDPLQIPSFLLPENARIIAFDLPTPYIKATAEGNVSVPPMLTWFDDLASWNFLGFDVVEIEPRAVPSNYILARMPAEAL